MSDQFQRRTRRAKQIYSMRQSSNIGNKNHGATGQTKKLIGCPDISSSPTRGNPTASRPNQYRFKNDVLIGNIMPQWHQPSRLQFLHPPGAPQWAETPVFPGIPDPWKKHITCTNGPSPPREGAASPAVQPTNGKLPARV